MLKLCCWIELCCCCGFCGYAHLTRVGDTIYSHCYIFEVVLLFEGENPLQYSRVWHTFYDPVEFTHMVWKHCVCDFHFTPISLFKASQLVCKWMFACFSVPVVLDELVVFHGFLHLLVYNGSGHIGWSDVDFHFNTPRASYTFLIHLYLLSGWALYNCNIIYRRSTIFIHVYLH